MTDPSRMLIESPLLEEARNCYLNRRKHSKRIKKLARLVCKAEPNAPTLRRIRSAPDPDQTDMLRILFGRQVPSFLIDLVKKKRIFNIGSIKKMAISIGSDFTELPPLSLVAEHCRKQETELQAIVTENNQRFEERRRIIALTRRNTVGPIGETHSSSTMSLDSPGEHGLDPDYQSQSQDDSGQVSVTEYYHGMLDFQEPMDLMRCDSDQHDIFMTMF